MPPPSPPGGEEEIQCSHEGGEWRQWPSVAVVPPSHRRCKVHTPLDSSPPCSFGLVRSMIMCVDAWINFREFMELLMRF